LVKAAQTGKIANIEMATAWMESALPVGGRDQSCRFALLRTLATSFASRRKVATSIYA